MAFIPSRRSRVLNAGRVGGVGGRWVGGAGCGKVPKAERLRHIEKPLSFTLMFVGPWRALLWPLWLRVVV